MARKSKSASASTQELPGVTGKGVAPLNIPDIAKAIRKYERAKEARCQASPGELTAKGELKRALQAHRDELPVNADGARFYRFTGGDDPVDYILDETVKRHAVDEDSADGKQLPLAEGATGKTVGGGVGPDDGEGEGGEE